MNQTPDLSGENVVARWMRIQTERDNRSLSEAWRILCEDLDYKAGGLSRLYQFRDGKRTPPPHVLRYMQRDVLWQLFTPDLGPIEEEQLEAWSIALSPPDRAGP